jgi:hypothetical protein
MTSIPGRFLNARTSGKYDQVGKRNLFPSSIKRCLDAFKRFNYFFQFSRNVDAEAQAVDTNCETVNPESSILAFNEEMSLSSIGF